MTDFLQPSLKSMGSVLRLGLIEITNDVGF